MKILNKMVMLSSVIISSSVYASEQVDVLFLVEPNVYQTLERENVQQLIQNQIDVANDIHKSHDTGIKYNAVAVIDWKDNIVSERLQQGNTFVGSVGDILYSVRFTESEYYKHFDFLTDVEPYVQESHDIFLQYHADNVVFISSSTEVNTRTVGYAIQNFGVVVGIEGMVSNPYLIAHEWGHNLGLGHVNNDTCRTSNLLMCAENSSGEIDGLTESELMHVYGVIAKDSNYYIDGHDYNYYLGWYSQPQVVMANINVSVLDNPIDNSLNQTEVVVSLIDDKGTPVTLDEVVSIELFTKGSSAIVNKHYESDIYQRVTFAPGESEKRFDLNVSHDTQDVSLIIGARYGLYVSDALPQTLTIKGKGSNEGEGGSDSSGGSFSWMGLLLLLTCRVFRK